MSRLISEPASAFAGAQGKGPFMAAEGKYHPPGEFRDVNGPFFQQNTPCSERLVDHHRPWRACRCARMKPEHRQKLTLPGRHADSL